MIRIAVISDIHSNLEALKEVLKDMGKVDDIVNAGDIVGYGPSPNECVSVVKGVRMKNVLGNHDLAAVDDSPRGFNPYASAAIHYTHGKLSDESTGFLSSLPSSAAFDLEEVKVCVYHGSPRDPINEYVFPSVPQELCRHFLEMTGADLLVLGHTHVPMIFRIGKRVVINPGGVGQPRDRDNRASYMIVEIDGDRIKVEQRRAAYDVDGVAKKMVKEGLPKFLAERLYYGM